MCRVSFWPRICPDFILSCSHFTWFCPFLFPFFVTKVNFIMGTRKVKNVSSYIEIFTWFPPILLLLTKLATFLSRLFPSWVSGQCVGLVIHRCCVGVRQKGNYFFFYKTCGLYVESILPYFRSTDWVAAHFYKTDRVRWKMSNTPLRESCWMLFHNQAWQESLIVFVVS